MIEKAISLYLKCQLNTGYNTLNSERECTINVNRELEEEGKEALVSLNIIIMHMHECATSAVWLIMKAL